MGSRGSRLFASVALLVLCASASARADTVRRAPGPVAAMACTSASHCLAAVNNRGQGSLLPITNGVPGAAVSLPANFSPAGMDCMSASSCLVVGSQLSGGGEGATSQGAIIPVENGAAGAEQIVQGVTEMRAVTCPTAGSCLALGRVYSGYPSYQDYAVVVPINNGRAGSPEAVNGTFLDAIACESPSSCIAVGNTVGRGAPAAGVVVRIANGVPGGPQPVSGTSDLFAVTCRAGTSACLAAGQLINGSSSQGVLVPLSGGAPGTAELVASSNSLWGVACPSATACVVSGVGGVETGVPIAGGGIGSWHPVPGVGYLKGIYCASETSCVVVGQDKTGDGVVVDIGSAPPSTPAAAVNQSLAVSGPSASIPAILSAGGYPASVSAPSAGTMKIVWYYLPPGARLARVSKPVVVAQGSKTFAAAGSLTVKLRLTAAGRKLLKHSKRMKLTAVGSFAPRHGKTATKHKSIILSSH